jgi:hypothetical protein
MMNDDKQTTESFSAQEGLQELEEQALEGVTGGGFFSKLFCFSCRSKPAQPVNTGSKPAGAATFEDAKQQNAMLKQAGLQERYRPGPDGHFYLKK